MQSEAMGESPAAIKEHLGYYSPECAGVFQFNKFAGLKKRRSLRKISRAIDALSKAGAPAPKKRRV
jgi:hypothetical protein